MKQFNKDGSLTKEFLTNRGWCCGNKCRNCPYEPRWTKGSTNLDNSEINHIFEEVKDKYNWSTDGINWQKPNPQAEFEHNIVFDQIFYKFNNKNNESTNK